MTSDSKKILLTGATGYIGGSVLTNLLNSSSLKSAQITCLLRSPDGAKLLSSTYGDRVKQVLYRDLDDIEATTRVAAEHDVVINTTVGFHSDSALALVRGLAQRKSATGREVWMIHTSGISNIGDKPITEPNVPIREFNDVTDDIYGHEKEQESTEPYPQRTTELAVIDTGLELGVKTVVIMSPVIYGAGTGLFNKTSMQTQTIKATLQRGQAAVVGDGEGEWDHVHVTDLADLYRLVLLEILERQGNALPTGTKGILFSANGRHSWLQYAQDVADACFEEGFLPEKTVAHLSVEEAVRTWMPHLGYFTKDQLAAAGPRIAELFATNARTVAGIARKLGWVPSKAEEAWKKAVRDDVKEVKASLMNK